MYTLWNFWSLIKLDNNELFYKAYIWRTVCSLSCIASIQQNTTKIVVFLCEVSIQQKKMWWCIGPWSSMNWPKMGDISNFDTWYLFILSHDGPFVVPSHSGLTHDRIPCHTYQTHGTDCIRHIKPWRWVILIQVIRLHILVLYNRSRTKLWSIDLLQFEYEYYGLSIVTPTICLTWSNLIQILFRLDRM
jgi:hypothetical protein